MGHKAFRILVIARLVGLSLPGLFSTSLADVEDVMSHDNEIEEWIKEKIYFSSP